MYGLKRVSQRRNDALSRVGWEQLELLLADHYRQKGYQAEHVGTGASGTRFDGGIDLKLRRESEYILVQCKHWNAMKVTHNAVHELLGIMVNEGASGAVLVTSGEFTKAAIEAGARHGHVRLIDGEELRTMIGAIPEPSHVARAMAPASYYVQHTKGFAGIAAERLLTAAEDRIRGGGRGAGRVRGVVRYSISAVVLKIALFLLFAWFVLVVMGGVFQSIIKTLAPKPPLTSSVSTAPAVRMTSAPADAASSPYVHRNSGSPTEDRHALPLTHQPTKAEMREWQRKADESMKILEKTTPEM